MQKCNLVLWLFVLEIPMAFSGELIQQARTTWQKRVSEPLTADESEEGLRNLIGFVLALSEAAQSKEQCKDEKHQTIPRSPLS